jgi:transposase InsO family protein
LPGLTCHSDAGFQFTSFRYGERLAEIGAVPSIGSIGDSLDSASAETVNGYYKAELIYGPARTNPWSKSNSPSLRKSPRDSVAVNDNVHCGVVGRWLLPHGVLQSLTLNLR